MTNDDLTTIRARWADAESWHLVETPYGDRCDELEICTVDGRTLHYVLCPNDADRLFAVCVAHAPADIRALLDALAVANATLQARALTVAELLSELALLRELRDDVERWRDAGGDVRDLRYVLETLDTLPESAAEMSSERLVTGAAEHERLNDETPKSE